MGVSGSIAAIEVPRLARELIRHGAQVEVVMTPDARNLLSPEAVRFATGKPPVTELTGDVEHIRLFGPGPGRADLLLLAPATANTLSKVALGIDDTPVTTCASVALGARVPVLVAPAMHSDMLRNPFVLQNLERLKAEGVTFIPPVEEEGESKLPGPEVLSAHVLHRLGTLPWRGRRVLVIGGSTSEPLDEVRSLTNEGSGRMALELAQQAFFRGAHVETWLGDLRVPIPSFLEARRFRTVGDLRELIREARARLRHMDAILVPAALSDFVPRARSGKIPSSQGSTLLVSLDRTEKTLPLLRRAAPSPTLLISFKLEAVPSGDELAARARASLAENQCDMVVANPVTTMGAEEAQVLLVRPEGKPHPYTGRKDRVAARLLEDIGQSLSPHEGTEPPAKAVPGTLRTGGSSPRSR